MFVSAMRSSLVEKSEFNTAAFNEELMDFEINWTQKKKTYPVEPRGDSYETARELYQKYLKQ